MKLELTQLRALAKAAYGKPAVMERLALDMSKLEAHDEAYALACEAAELAPDDADIADTVRNLRGKAVPKWHFSIVRDQIRNDAYEAALRRVVTPSSKVFEVGTGTGLLAMMAARAGAACVYTCECNPLVAAHARKVVEHNGLSDRIHVLEKNSKDVTLEDIGGSPADVFVSEIVSNDLLREDALAVTPDVVPRLIRPGGAIIPYDGSVRVALIEDPEPRPRPMGVINGFDLSPFNPLRHLHYRIFCDTAKRLVLRSAPADLFTFDFSGRRYSPETAKIALTATGGLVSGVVQWMRIGLDAASGYENVPGTIPDSCWDLAVYSFPEPLALPAGSRVMVYGRHDCTNVYLRAEPVK